MSKSVFVYIINRVHRRIIVLKVSLRNKNPTYVRDKRAELNVGMWSKKYI